jgi:hypothetical protein
MVAKPSIEARIVTRAHEGIHIPRDSRDAASRSLRVRMIWKRRDEHRGTDLDSHKDEGRGVVSSSGRDPYPLDSDRSQVDGSGDHTDSDGHQSRTGGSQTRGDGSRSQSGDSQMGSDASPPSGSSQPGSDGSRYSKDPTHLGGARHSQLEEPRRRSENQEDDLRPPDYLEAAARARAQKEREERRRAPGTWMPGPDDFDRDPEPSDDTEFGTDGPVREYTSRQIGVRLRPKQFERLLECARLYGVRPTTMARMMIVRGTNAIHEAELRSRAREWREAGSE